MARSAIEVFDDQIGDAEQMLSLARSMLKGPRTVDQEEPPARALLRQAIVAAAAAVESYVAVKAAACLPDALAAKKLPDRLGKLEMPLEKALTAARGRSPRSAFQSWAAQALEDQASADPGVIGAVFSAVGEGKILQRCDSERMVDRGTSERQMKELASRRNQIAHRGDRTAQGRRKLAVNHVETHVRNARQVAEALEKIL